MTDRPIHRVQMGGLRVPSTIEFLSEIDRLTTDLAAARAEVARLRADLLTLAEAVGRVNDKLGALIRTMPKNELSTNTAATISDASAMAFRAWEAAAEAARREAK